MIVAITKVARIGVRLGFEYELRQNDGTLITFDHVVIALKAGETRADIVPLIRSYLRLRVLKWALSDTPEKVARRKERRVGERLTRYDQLLADEPYTVQIDFAAARAEQLVREIDLSTATPKQRRDIKDAKAAGDTTLLAQLLAPFTFWRERFTV